MKHRFRISYGGGVPRWAHDSGEKGLDYRYARSELVEKGKIDGLIRKYLALGHKVEGDWPWWRRYEDVEKANTLDD